MLPGVAQITGVWQGRSVSRAKDETQWEGTVITAKPDENSVFDSVIVEGHGISVWKRKSIPFVIKGTYDPTTKLLQFRKRHYGAYNNEILYKGILLPSSAHTTARFEGVYDHGTIELAKTASISAGLPLLFSGSYSATCSFDGITQQWDDVNVTIMSRGDAQSSMYKDGAVTSRVFQLSGSGTAYDTSLARDGSGDLVRSNGTASEIVLGGTLDPVSLRVTVETWSRRTQERMAFECLINPSTMEIATLNDQEQQPVQEVRMVPSNRDLLLEIVPNLWRNAIVAYQLQFAASESNSNAGSEGRGMRQYAARKEEIRALCELLRGVWTGITTDVHGRVTHLKPLRMTAEHEHDNLYIKLEANGESVWNDMVVQYTLRGGLDITSLQFELAEHFRDVIRSPARYTGMLCLTSKSAEPPLADNAERFVSPSDIRQLLDSIAGGAFAPCLRGDFERGKILLWQPAAGQEQDVQHHSVAAAAAASRASVPAPRSPVAATESNVNVVDVPTTAQASSQIQDLPYNSTSPRSSEPDPSRVTRYRLLLCNALLSGKRITEKDRKVLRSFKEAEGITDEEHQQVLHDLGWTTDMLDLSAEGSASSAGEASGIAKEPQDDLCTLCCENPIDSVFIPCGHFIVCKKCARKVRDCPACRREITKIQAVYR